MPFGPGGAAKPMPEGRKPEPGGWNRIIINVDDLPAEVAGLRTAKSHFRKDIVSGPGGSEILRMIRQAIRGSRPNSDRVRVANPLQSP
jgi:hypothetical protein